MVWQGMVVAVVGVVVGGGVAVVAVVIFFFFLRSGVQALSVRSQVKHTCGVAVVAVVVDGSVLSKNCEIFLL